MDTLAVTIALSLLWGALHGAQAWSESKDARHASIFFVVSALIGLLSSLAAAWAWLSFVDANAGFYAIANFFLVVGAIVRLLRQMFEYLFVSRSTPKREDP